MRAGGAACCWCWYTFDAWVPSSLEVGTILMRDPVQVWAITAPSQPLFPMTRHSLTVLARHSMRQWHRRVWSCLVVSGRCEGCASCISLYCDSTGLGNTHQGRRAAHERSTRPVTTKSSHQKVHTLYLTEVRTCPWGGGASQLGGACEIIQICMKS